MSIKAACGDTVSKAGVHCYSGNNVLYLLHCAQGSVRRREHMAQNDLLGRVVRVLRVDATVYEEIEADKDALTQALIIVVVAAVTGGIGGIGAGGASGLVRGIIVGLLGWFIWAGVIYLLGTKVFATPQTKADLPEVMRVLGFAYAPSVFGIVGILGIPVLTRLVGLAILIWVVVGMVIAIKATLDYTSTGRAILVAVLGLVAYIIVGVIIGALTGGAGMMGM
ncbi:MAG: hypothetical protein EXR67_05910 [Dehalococcoidia bacterium]|nr:hypothetical protein [Dehalococcoidia bacterium]